MRKYFLASAAICALYYSIGGVQAQSIRSPSLEANPGAPNGSSSFPEPGSVLIRLGGALEWFAVETSDTGDKSTALGAGGTGSNAKFKKGNYSFGDYVRLYPTIDGVAANGLRFGVYSELRADNVAGAGGGSVGSVSGQGKSQNIYARRAYGYFGLANLGYIRVGTGDGVGGLFDTGSFQNFDAGGWNGDIEGLISGNAQVTFPFMGGNSAFYGTNKLTYLSPQISGFEFGVSYEPNTNSVGFTETSNAASGSDRLDSSSVQSDLKRRRNTINPAVRYRNTFGPVGLALEASYTGSASTSYDGTPTADIQKFKGLNFENYGIVTTYGGLSVGGQVMMGSFNGSGNLAPQGSRNAFAYIAGASYTVGPIIVGASFYQYNSAGNSGSTTALRGTSTLATVGQERERGVAVGGTYTIVPGVSLFVSGLYGDRLENGWDLVNGAQSVKGSSQGNATRAQTVGFGTDIRW